ncbi:HS12A-like protein, partial [Mya arenaria]
MYVTDKGCHFAGTLDVPIEGSGLARSVNVRMIYAGTEIEVEATEVATGKKLNHKPELITQRGSKYTYGLGMKRPFVDNVHNEYYKVIREDGKVCCAGQCLFVGEAQVEKSYTPAKSSKTAICFPVYYTHATDPVYTTDDGCYCAGNMIVPIGGTPTCVLIEPDGETFSAFGFDAETKYTHLVEAEEHDKWYFFKRFKMQLYNKDIKRDMKIEDETGKKLNAQLAGISSDKLILALEPEAAAIYCRHIPAKKGEEGGTVDIAVQEVTDNGSMKNIYKASGGDWGGTKVDEAYVKFLERILGTDTIDAFRRCYMEDYIYMIRDFEMKKRDVDPLKSDKPVVFRVSAMLPKLVKKSRGKKIHEAIKDSQFDSTVSIQGDKLKVDMSIVTNFFKTQVDSIVEHVSNLIDQSNKEDIASIVLVGGFSNCPLLQQAMKTTFDCQAIIIPNDPDLAVLKGAVIFGHRPEMISQRVSKYTYGTNINAHFIEHVHRESYKEINEN